MHVFCAWLGLHTTLWRYSFMFAPMVTCSTLVYSIVHACRCLMLKFARGTGTQSWDLELWQTDVAFGATMADRWHIWSDNDKTELGSRSMADRWHIWSDNDGTQSWDLEVWQTDDTFGATMADSWHIWSDNDETQSWDLEVWQTDDTSGATMADRWYIWSNNDGTQSWDLEVWQTDDTYGATMADRWYIWSDKMPEHRAGSGGMADTWRVWSDNYDQRRHGQHATAKTTSQASWRRCCCDLPQLRRTHERQCVDDANEL